VGDVVAQWVICWICGEYGGSVGDVVAQWGMWWLVVKALQIAPNYKRSSHKFVSGFPHGLLNMARNL
jgi:hypothetical protein